VQPRVSVGTIPLESPDGIFTIGRDAFPNFSWFAHLGVHVQSDRVRVAHPDEAYVENARRIGKKVGNTADKLG